MNSLAIGRPLEQYTPAAEHGEPAVRSVNKTLILPCASAHVTTKVELNRQF